LFRLAKRVPYRPDLCFAGSTSLYVVPFTGAGGNGSPFTEVTSEPFPPRGPICWYRPDTGTVSPGLNPLGLFDIVFHLPSVLKKLMCAPSPAPPHEP